jgi:hypothetical protein
MSHLYMRIIGMEKEKRTGRPSRRWIIVGVLTVILASLCWACSYYVFPGHSLSEFSRFESAEEVVAFLHEHFDLNVTTSHDILTFMEAYPLEDDGCQDSTPEPWDFEDYVVNEDVINIIDCKVSEWGTFEGTVAYYLLRFYIDTNDRLVYISARSVWLGP